MPPTRPARRSAQPRRQPDKLHTLNFKVPADLVAKIDAIAAREERSRAKMIEILLRSAVERRPA
jgi:hypothetical protein